MSWRIVNVINITVWSYRRQVIDIITWLRCYGDNHHHTHTRCSLQATYECRYHYYVVVGVVVVPQPYRCLVNQPRRDETLLLLSAVSGLRLAVRWLHHTPPLAHYGGTVTS